MSAETYPPLSESDFADGTGYEYRGIPICEDENAYYIYAWGWRDPETFAKAVNDYDREMQGWDDGTAYGPEAVEHVWAAVTVPPDSPDGWWITWSNVSESTPGAFRLSVIQR